MFIPACEHTTKKAINLVASAGVGHIIGVLYRDNRSRGKG